MNPSHKHHVSPAGQMFPAGYSCPTQPQDLDSNPWTLRASEATQPPSCRGGTVGGRRGGRQQQGRGSHDDGQPSCGCGCGHRQGGADGARADRNAIDGDTTAAHHATATAGAAEAGAAAAAGAPTSIDMVHTSATAATGVQNVPLGGHDGVVHPAANPDPNQARE